MGNESSRGSQQPYRREYIRQGGYSYPSNSGEYIRQGGNGGYPSNAVIYSSDGLALGSPYQGQYASFQENPTRYVVNGSRTEDGMYITQSYGATNLSTTYGGPAMLKQKVIDSD